MSQGGGVGKLVRGVKPWTLVLIGAGMLWVSFHAVRDQVSSAGAAKASGGCKCG